MFLEVPVSKSSVIQNSWRRCADQGLAIDYPARQDPISSCELAVRKEQNHILLQLASRELDLLRESLSTEGMVVLASADGVILDARGDSEFMGRARRVSLQPGAVWTEDKEGTNAIGTAAVEHGLIQVRGEEHFLQENRFLICTAMPVMNPSGILAGIIDVTGDIRRPPGHCEMLVRLAAANIEHSWARQTDGHDVLVAFHPHPSSLGSPYEGVLAFRDGVLIGASQVALYLLGLGSDAICQARWNDLFNAPLAAGELRLQADGARFYAHVECSAPRRPARTRLAARPHLTVLEDTVWDPETLDLLRRAERAV
jgi:sigma-54 dependent transcriptional regulator, acetoin dehydrogenase operon transcriptional activator AcoR